MPNDTIFVPQQRAAPAKGGTRPNLCLGSELDPGPVLRGLIKCLLHDYAILARAARTIGAISARRNQSKVLLKSPIWPAAQARRKSRADRRRGQPSAAP